MVRKEYDLGEGAMVVLEYNPRKKNLEVLINGKSAHIICEPGGCIGTSCMCSEQELIHEIQLTVPTVKNTVTVYFNCTEYYSHAELYIDNRSAENAHRIMPSAPHTSSMCWHYSMWTLYYLFLVLVVVFIILTMLIGFIVLVIVLLIYIGVMSALNKRTFHFNVRSRVTSSSVALEDVV